MNHELLYQLALTQVPNIGDVHAKILLQHFGSASAVFAAKAPDLERLEGIGSVRAQSLRRFRDFDGLQPELKFLERYGISTHFFTEPHYPQRLQHCYDPPALLFSKGAPDLNVARIVAIVGTRNASEYGRQWTEKFISELAPFNTTIVSGLAFGIDAVAHKAALKFGLPTVAVVAHGLAHLYPSEHAGLARELVRAGGGIFTEHLSHVKPDKHHFPLRNRIVAGICDAVVVVETAVKGGSMITARLADSYNRDVFALPGRVIDKGSSGCLHLIRTQKAQLITGAEDFVESMGWTEKKNTAPTQSKLFLDLNDEERTLVEILERHSPVHIDELNLQGNFRPSQLAGLLLELEFKGVVRSLPGKQFRLA
jgi:DNA processing protein